MTQQKCALQPYADQQQHAMQSDVRVACRNEVVAWLASIGAERSVPTKKQTGLPTLSEEQWQQLQPKAARAAIVAKEPAVVQPKGPVTKAKEPSSKAKEASAAKPKDSTAALKTKGRPRCSAKLAFLMLPLHALMPFLASLAKVEPSASVLQMLLDATCCHGSASKFSTS